MLSGLLNFTNPTTMNEAVHIHQLIAKVCQHPRGSRERQTGLNEIIYRIQQSGKLFRGDGVPNREDALQETWLYFCRNIDYFDPEQANVFTWLNKYLHYRLLDCHRQFSQEKSSTDSDHPLIKPRNYRPIR